MKYTYKILLNSTSRYFIIKIISSISSFLFFSLFLYKIQKTDIKNAISFMFLMGFSISYLKFLLQISFSLNSISKTGNKIQSLHKGFNYLINTLIIILPIFVIIFYINTHNIYLTLFSIIIISLSVMDVDLVRSVLNKDPIFPLLLFVGTMISILFLFIIENIRYENLIFIVLLQWIPCSIYNLFFFSKYFIIRSIELLYRKKLFYSIVLLSGFDGVVLNFPFFGIYSISRDVEVELSLVLRIFSASIQIYPLLINWSNSKRLINMSQMLKFSEKKLFISILFLTSAIIGYLYLSISLIINNHFDNIRTYIYFLIILFSYSIYSSFVRYLSPLIKINSLLIIIFTLYFILTILIDSSYNSPQVIYIILIQSSLLLLFSLLVYMQSNKNQILL